MSKRDLLRKANAGNAEKRGTEAVLNDTSTVKTLEKPSVDASVHSVKPIVDVKPSVISSTVTKETITSSDKIPVELTTAEEEKPEIELPISSESLKSVDSLENVKTSITSITEDIKTPEAKETPTKTNLEKYKEQKASLSIMISSEYNKYLIKRAAAEKKSIQDIFGEIMADEIERVKAGDIDETLADSFLKLRANNERRNVQLPKDLITAIADTAALIPLKQGKFILYSLSRKIDK